MYSFMLYTEQLISVSYRTESRKGKKGKRWREAASWWVVGVIVRAG